MAGRPKRKRVLTELEKFRLTGLPQAVFVVCGYYSKACQGA